MKTTAKTVPAAPAPKAYDPNELPVELMDALIDCLGDAAATGKVSVVGPILRDAVKRALVEAYAQGRQAGAARVLADAALATGPVGASS